MFGHDHCNTAVHIISFNFAGNKMYSGPRWRSWPFSSSFPNEPLWHPGLHMWATAPWTRAGQSTWTLRILSPECPSPRHHASEPPPPSPARDNQRAKRGGGGGHHREVNVRQNKSIKTDGRKEGDAGETQNVNCDLCSTEAERGEFGVGPLGVDHQQTLILIQTQVPARCDVTNAERLTPLHVAAAPAAGRTRGRGGNHFQLLPCHYHHSAVVFRQRHWTSI